MSGVGVLPGHIRRNVLKPRFLGHQRIFASELPTFNFYIKQDERTCWPTQYTGGFRLLHGRTFIPRTCKLNRKVINGVLQCNRNISSHSDDQNIALADDKEKTSYELINKLIFVAKPEYKLILASAATLGVTSTITLILPYASGQMIDIALLQAGGGVESNTMLPYTYALGLFGLTAVGGIGVFCRTVMINIAGNRIVARIRRQLFASSLAQEIAFFDRTNTGDLLTRLSADTQLVQAAVTTHVVSGLRGIVMSLGSSGLLLYSSPPLAFASMVSLPPAFLAAKYFGRRLKTKQKVVQEMHSEATAIAEEVFQGVKTVRQFAGEQIESDKYSWRINKAHKKAMELGVVQGMFDSTLHVAANGAILGVLGYGGSMVMDGSMTAGDLAGFLMYSLLMAGNIGSLSNTYAEIMKALGASGRVFDIIDRTPLIPMKISVTESDQLNSLDFFNSNITKGTFEESQSKNASYPASIDPLSIEFKNVHFAYPTRKEASILGPGFDFSVDKGEVVAIVGGSGSGKSTVAALITRLYDISGKDGEKSDGLILINGEDIRKLDPLWLRLNVGVVAQEPLLFSGTIAENIRYGKMEATDEEVLNAAKLANVIDFTQNLPLKLETEVGQGGTQLSGGQKQRVAIARVVLKNPPIVILDEATSALDAESEYLVQKAIESAMRGKTVICIAHRLNTIKGADRIVVLQSGVIVEAGAFSELVDKKGAFHELMKRQITK